MNVKCAICSKFFFSGDKKGVTEDGSIAHELCLAAFATSLSTSDLKEVSAPVQVVDSAPVLPAVLTIPNSASILTHTPDLAPSTDPSTDLSPRRSVFVSALAWDTTNEDLIAHFMVSGMILKAEVLKRHRRGSKNKTSTGLGIVEFRTSEDATNAVKMLHRSILRDRKIRCKIDEQPESTVSTPAQPPSLISIKSESDPLNKDLPKRALDTRLNSDLLMATHLLTNTSSHSAGLNTVSTTA